MENNSEKSYIISFIEDILKDKLATFQIITTVNQQTDSETLPFFFEDFENEFKAISGDYFFEISKNNDLIQICDKMIEDVNFQINENVIIEDLQFIKDFINDSKDLYHFTPRELMKRIEVSAPYFMAYNVIAENYGNTSLLYKIYKIIKSKTNPTIEDRISNVDLSDTSATDKIIYLQKLGVIDFLRKQQPFSTSINSLATVLSAVTGAKSGTLQPMLNAMLGKNISDKNNPLNSEKPVAKVKKQLNDIGFNLNETN
jgi:hypothetical protein